MKRSVNFNGFQHCHRRISADDLIATYRALGMTNKEILEEMKKLQAVKAVQQQNEAEAEQPPQSAQD
jgi:hypothetical protein